MGNRLLVRPHDSFQNKQEQSWRKRVQENAHAFFALRGVKLSAAGGGAFDLIDARSAPGTRQRQAVSILLHGLVVCGILITGRQVVEKLPPVRGSSAVPCRRINGRVHLELQNDQEAQMGLEDI